MTVLYTDFYSMASNYPEKYFVYLAVFTRNGDENQIIKQDQKKRASNVNNWTNKDIYFQKTNLHTQDSHDFTVFLLLAKKRQSVNLTPDGFAHASV